MTKQDGFTLIELLIVLLLVSVLVLATVPSVYAIKKKVEENAFKQLLDTDILYIQNQAFHYQRDYRLGFLSQNNQYVIRGNSQEERPSREIPQHITPALANTNIIYTPSGRVRIPRSYSFIIEDKVYQLIFSLGKGRHRIAEN